MLLGLVSPPDLCMVSLYTSILVAWEPYALAIESNLCEQVHWRDYDPFKYIGNVNWGGVMDQRF